MFVIGKAHLEGRRKPFLASVSSMLFTNAVQYLSEDIAQQRLQNSFSILERLAPRYTSGSSALSPLSLNCDCATRSKHSGSKRILYSGTAETMASLQAAGGSLGFAEAKARYMKTASGFPESLSGPKESPSPRFQPSTLSPPTSCQPCALWWVPKRLTFHWTGST